MAPTVIFSFLIQLACSFSISDQTVHHFADGRSSLYLLSSHANQVGGHAEQQKCTDSQQQNVRLCKQ